MASAITGNARLDLISTRDVARLSVSDYHTSREHLIVGAWPKGVPLQGVEISANYDVPTDTTLVGFKWRDTRDFGRQVVDMGHAIRVHGPVGLGEVDLWRKEAIQRQRLDEEDRARTMESLARPIHQRKPQIVPCTGCGMDTFGDPNNIYDKTNALCYYCQELRDVHAANVKATSHLSWIWRRRVRKHMGWKRERVGTQSSGPL